MILHCYCYIAILATIEFMGSLTVYKIMSSGSFRNISTKLLHEWYIFDIDVKTGFGIK